MCYNVYDDNLKKYLTCENWYMQNKIETIVPGGNFHEAFYDSGDEDQMGVDIKYRYFKSLYWEMYFGDYYYDIVFNRKISGLIGLLKLFVSQFSNKNIKIHNFWDYQWLSNDFFRNGNLNEDILEKDFDIFLKMLSTNNWNWFTDYSSRFYYYGGNYGPSINTKLFLYSEDVFKLHEATNMDTFKYTPIRSFIVYLTYGFIHQIHRIFGYKRRSANRPSREKQIIRPYLKYYAQKKLSPKVGMDYKLFYTNLTPLVYKNNTKLSDIIPFMRDVNNSPGSYNYNKPLSFMNKTVFKTLRNLDDYHHNLSPAWSFSLYDWGEPEEEYDELVVPALEMLVDIDWFLPSIKNRGLYRNKIQFETSRKLPIFVFHFQHYVLYYFMVFFAVLYTGGTETFIKETLKENKYKLKFELVRKIEFPFMLPPFEQAMYASYPRKYVFKNKLRTITFFIIIFILILLYPLYFI